MNWGSTKRLHAGVLALAAVVIVGIPLTASADNVEVLLGPTNQSITFTGTSSSTADLLQLGTCSSGICTWAESGGSILHPYVSSGENQLGGYSGVWSLSIPYTGSTDNLTLAFSGSDGTTTDWDVKQPYAITFDWGTAGCSGSGCYLTGSLELTNIQQTGNGGIFDLGVDANLTITGGSLASLVGTSGNYDYTINFASGTSLSDLGNGKTLEATGSSGEVLANTPEPNSQMLVASGLGLLLVGAMMRRRLGHAS
jgi:hypothetical protein